MNITTLGLYYLFILSNRKDKAITTLLFWYIVQVTLTIIVCSPQSFIFLIEPSWFYVISATVCYLMKNAIDTAKKHLNDHDNLNKLDIILTSAIYLNLFGILDLTLNQGRMVLNYNIFINGAALLTVLEVWYLFCLSKNGLFTKLNSFISNIARGLHSSYSFTSLYSRNNHNLVMGQKTLDKG